MSCVTKYHSEIYGNQRNEQKKMKKKKYKKSYLKSFVNELVLETDGISKGKHAIL